jgi:hypothetical protein
MCHFGFSALFIVVVMIVCGSERFRPGRRGSRTRLIRVAVDVDFVEPGIRSCEIHNGSVVDIHLRRSLSPSCCPNECGHVCSA